MQVSVQVTQRSTDSTAWRTPFVPRPWLRNAHLQTIAGNYLRRTGTAPSAPATLIVPVEPPHIFKQPDGTQIPVPQTSVLCLCHWQPEPSGQLTVVLVHGLEGSASSGYILGNAMRLWQDGCNVVRMNMRSCGGSDSLAPTIYHSGRSGDIAAIVETLEQQGHTRIALVGYSMGANLVLRYAGEQSLLAPLGRHQSLRAMAGISPLLDLAPSSTALHLPSNQLYERRFLRAMKGRLRAKARLFPQLYNVLEREGVHGRIRSLRDFDGQIVARYGGFRDADDYYEQVRSSRYAGSFDLPTLIVHAADDPFIRTLPATRAALRANPHVDYLETEYGGHCAFVAAASAEDQGRWAEETIARWLAVRAGA